MKVIKKNKVTIIVIILFVFVVFVVAEIKNFLVPDDAKAVYGDRLDGIEDHPLSDATLKGINDKLKENKQVVDSSSIVHGKIINFIITVADNVSVSDAKKIASSSLDMFKNGELDFYSLNVYVKKDNAELNNFPIEGYKGPSSTSLIFTKDREITKEVEDEK